MYSRSDSAAADGWHVVTLVGWDDADDSWIARNSWGDDWGDEGYFKISRDTDCSITLKGACVALHVNYFDVDPARVPGMPCLTETSVAMFAREGEQDDTVVEVSNCGNASHVDVQWESDVSWLSADIEGATLAVGGVSEAAVVASAAELKPGVHEGEIRFVGGPGVSTLRVTFEVEALPEPEPPAVEPSPDAVVDAPTLRDAGDALPDSAAPATLNKSPTNDDEGCGCRTAGAASDRASLWLCAFVALGWLHARRRQHPLRANHRAAFSCSGCGRTSANTSCPSVQRANASTS